MNMKQLLSIALLVSALTAAPIFAMDNGGGNTDNTSTTPPQNNPPQNNPPQNNNNQNNNDGSSWGDTLAKPFTFAWSEFTDFLNTTKGLTWGNGQAGPSRQDLLFNKRNFWYGAIAGGIFVYVVDHIDEIKEALGLSDEQADDASQIFASVRCGCEDAQQEEQKEEACSLEEKRAEKIKA